ncbi:putative zinc finger protein [Orchesella cincta]|uniref:Putative zinc finger protein n=1 Tax=Orchesella cincta TaxID=48709 RepID=A0A1D2M8I5_ORCCI|nr:putative zinc finger protein [Orchesella cincta]
MPSLFQATGEPRVHKNTHVVHYNKEERIAAIKRGEKRPPPMKKPFQCDQCVKKFVKELELQRHKNFAHNPLTHRQEIQKVDESTFLFHSVTLSKVLGGKYKCSACDSILETMNAAKSRVISVHTRFYKCDLCERRFPYPAGLQKHLESTHKQGSTSYCPTCRSHLLERSPKHHLWTHYSEEEKQEALARGEKVPHTIVKRYQCEQCASSFTCESAMRKHQQRAHEGVPQEKKICGVCGAAVVSLLAHMKQSHPKEEDFRFSCSVCDKKFAQYTRLKTIKRSNMGLATC